MSAAESLSTTALGTVHWLGSFRSGYEIVSEWVNGQWITRPGKNWRNRCAGPPNTSNFRTP